MRHAGLLALAIILLVVGVGGLAALVVIDANRAATTPTTVTSQGGGPAMMPPGSGGTSSGSGGTSLAGTYTSIGQEIYLTGVGGAGQTISHTAPRVSQGALMMGGGGCASCHGADGRGGTIQMMMGTTIEAPDVTYGALVAESFDDSTIARAIRDGLDETGAALDTEMPRWQMNDSDMSATIEYLKELSAK